MNTYIIYIYYIYMNTYIIYIYTYYVNIVGTLKWPVFWSFFWPLIDRTIPGEEREGSGLPEIGWNNQGGL